MGIFVVAAPGSDALTQPGSARAAGGLLPCEGSPVASCGTVVVPLDRRGVLPGRVSLYVEVVRAEGSQRGFLFLLAGGPGQAATDVFDLARDPGRWRSRFPGYALVAFDARGTGRSDLLRCPSFGVQGMGLTEAMATCANSLGPAASVYSTRDHAEDVEAVRLALGARKIALWGTSYGAKHAVAYALAHPKGVERLLLDSPLAPSGPHPFASDRLSAMPRALRSLCEGFCSGATRHLGTELPALANVLQRAPLKTDAGLVDGHFMLSLAFAADGDGGVRAQLPAAVAEARRGRPDMLLRLKALSTDVPGPADPGYPLFVATTCGDGSFPWRPETPLADRQRAYEAAVSRLRAGATGPFGRWAAELGPTRFCASWPPSGSGMPLPAGRGPRVPVLVLSGGHDMRTPTETARKVAARFQGARILVMPGVGHSALVSDVSGCAERAVAAWLAGSKPAATCPRGRPVLSPVVPVTAPPKQASERRRWTLAAVDTTLRSAASAWYAFGQRAGRRGAVGLFEGRLSGAGSYRFNLERFSDVRGVALTGQIEVFTASRGPVLQLRGTVTVEGSRASSGTLTVSGNRLSGTLGGVAVER